MGVESPDPGIAAFHLMFWLPLHSIGGAAPSTTPVWLVPPYGPIVFRRGECLLGENSRESYSDKRDGFRPFIMGVLLVSSVLLTGRIAVEVSKMGKYGNVYQTLDGFWVARFVAWGHSRLIFTF